MANKKSNSYDVFISYRRASGGWAYARFVAELLKNAGFSVFIDVDILNQDAFGANYENVIREGIKASQCVIFVLVEKALDRCVSDPDDVLKKEMLWAIEYKKKLIPLTDGLFEMPEGLDPRLQAIFENEKVKLDDRNYKKMIDCKIIDYLSKITHKKPIKDDEAKNKYVGLLSVGKENNLLIDYGASSANKDICLRESEVYKRNAKRLFNTNDNNVELKVLPIKDSK